MDPFLDNVLAADKSGEFGFSSCKNSINQYIVVAGSRQVNKEKYLRWLVNQILVRQFLVNIVCRSRG